MNNWLRSRASNLSIMLWLVVMAVSVAVVARSHFVADMSAFLPRNPNAQQQALIDQLTRGSLSRTLLLGIKSSDTEQGGTVVRELSRKLATAMRNSGQYALVSNGEGEGQEQAQEIFLRYRYLLSPTVTPERFNEAGLHQAFANSINGLSSGLGSGLKQLLTRDPTGEMLELLSNFASASRPHSVDGVWMSKDEQRAVLIALTKADGANTDAQENVLQQIRQQFEQAKGALKFAGMTSAQEAELLVSGSAVFAVSARHAIKSEVVRLSVLGTLGVLTLLLFVFRSPTSLGLCLLPVLSGALAGAAAVSLAFGSIHSITVAFGSTLIGEAVDYSIYYFIQSQQHSISMPHAAHDNRTGAGSRQWVLDFWPTIRLGMLISVFGFSALMFSDFPGLAQLGVYSVTGLSMAALMTRFILPKFSIRAMYLQPSAVAITRLDRVLAGLQKLPKWALMLSAIALLFLVAKHQSIWSSTLSSFSPVSIKAQQLDEQLRTDLGAPQMRFLLVARAADEETALLGAEQAGMQLQQLQEQGLIESFESPSKLIPSRATQLRRQAALPAPEILTSRLQPALRGLPLQAERLKPFVADVAATRQLSLLSRESLGQSSLALGFDALMLHGTQGFTAFLPVRQGAEMADKAESERADKLAKILNLAAQRAQENLLANITTNSAAHTPTIRFIDVATESTQIYAKYFDEVLLLSGVGLLAIVLLLAFSLKSWRRTWAVLLPVALSVLWVMAALVAAGEKLNLLHLVGMLLIVAVGSNYALFFNRLQPGCLQPTTLASVLLANASTAVGFGVLAFSNVPVLHAIGTTVAPGAVLALLLSAVFAVDVRLERHAGSTTRP